MSDEFRQALLSLAFQVSQDNRIISEVRYPYTITVLKLTLPMLRLLLSKHKHPKIFKNHLNPVILVFIRTVSLSTLR